IIELHLDLLRDTREKTQQIPGRREKRWREHQAILQAIKERDSVKAGEAMLKHLRNVREIVAGM
ncbi:MAG: FCD domain-containing protein, partial [Candidatus Caldatribacteriota bacterium]|nr:FCD domain-containing protein [Candidatus Caldatribacteriota bacterium]